MSLELALQQNTAAINALVEILAKGLPAAPAPEAKTKKVKPAEQAAIVEQHVAETVAAVEVTAEEIAALAPEIPAAPVTIDDCKALILAVSTKKGRAAAVGLLAGFNASKLSEVPAARFAELKAEAEKVLAS